jgi:hypothetical protein
MEKTRTAESARFTGKQAARSTGRVLILHFVGKAADGGQLLEARR